MSGIALGMQIGRQTPALDARARALRNPRGLMAARGKRLERELRSHFVKKDAEGNKKGWPRSHFWSRRIRANTALTEVAASHAVVTIAAPEMAQKVFGGKIVPKESKYLALPAIAEAKGRSPRVVDGLHFEPRRGGTLRGVLKDEGGKTWYWLRSSVTQNPDPTALPKVGALEKADIDETEKYLARADRRASV